MMPSPAPVRTFVLRPARGVQRIIARAANESTRLWSLKHEARITPIVRALDDATKHRALSNVMLHALARSFCDELLREFPDETFVVAVGEPL